MRRDRRFWLGLALASVSTLALAACGGGASSSTSTAGTAASTQAAGVGFNRAALVACLKKQGITLPARPAGGAPRVGGGLFGGGGARANGARRLRFGANPALRAALQKCGLRPRAAGLPGLRASAAFKAAINRFVACVRQHGYALPAPNLSGRGPVFRTAQVNPRNPKFLAAARSCQGLLRLGRPRATVST